MKGAVMTPEKARSVFNCGENPRWSRIHFPDTRKEYGNALEHGPSRREWGHIISGQTMPFRTSSREAPLGVRREGCGRKQPACQRSRSLVLWASIESHLRSVVAMLSSALPPTTIQSNLANSLLLLPALGHIQQPQRVLILGSWRMHSSFNRASRPFQRGHQQAGLIHRGAASYRHL